MSSAREIRTKIGSIKNTQKITRAMEMVAASKMRKAQQRMLHARPYATKIRQVIHHLAKSHPEYRHAFLTARPVTKRAGLIIITSDRGLCGGLNMNILRSVLHRLKDWQKQHIETDLCLIGSKAESFFKRYGGNITAQATHLGDQPTMADLIGVIKIMLDHYAEGKLDTVFIIHNEFINSMTQKPRWHCLLPIMVSDIVPELVGNTPKTEPVSRWDYLYEPEAKELLDLVLKRYIESQIYQSIIENVACEQAARMVAMKHASDNAGDLIDELQLAYNKARQSAITQELAEIVAGAAAV